MKQKNGTVPTIHLENFLEKMKLVKRKKTRNVNKQAIYTIIYPKKEKDKRREYAHENYRNLSEEDKNKEYRYVCER